MRLVELIRELRSAIDAKAYARALEAVGELIRETARLLNALGFERRSQRRADRSIDDSVTPADRASFDALCDAIIAETEGANQVGAVTKFDPASVGGFDRRKLIDLLELIGRFVLPLLLD